MAGIASNNRRTGPSTPANGITVLTYDFPAYTKAEIGVYRIAPDGTITKLTLTVDYTVTLGDAHADAGGTVTLVVAADGLDQYVIYGESDDGSTFQFAGSKIDQVAIDNEFYQIRQEIQELKEQLARSMIFDRSLTKAIADLVLPAAAGGFLNLTDITDPVTLAFATPTDVTGTTITPFAETFLDDANAAAVRTTIGVDSKANTDAHAALAGAHQNIVMLDEPVIKVNTTVTTIAFTDVDISADTGSDTARIAILRVKTTATGYTTGTNSRSINLRENDKTPTQPYTLNIATLDDRDIPGERTIFLPLDSSEVFEYEITNTGFATATFANLITLEGYVI